MRIAVMGGIPYHDVVDMTRKERQILAETIKEKISAQNPNKKTQQSMVPGQVNGPTGPSARPPVPR